MRKLRVSSGHRSWILFVSYGAGCWTQNLKLSESREFACSSIQNCPFTRCMCGVGGLICMEVINSFSLLGIIDTF